MFSPLFSFFVWLFRTCRHPGILRPPFDSGD